MDRLLPWLRRSGWAYVAAALALALLAWRLAPGGSGGQPAPAAAAAAAVPATDAEEPEAPGAVVHVAGEVRRPGVYELEPGARVIEAVRRAGGPTRRADMSALNLAAAVTDGQQVRLPRRAAPGAPATGGGEAAAGTAAGAGPISLSTATAEQLDAIDGIGPTIAARIIAWRDARGGVASVDQLLEVPGIGPGRLEALRPHVVP
ncbi:MAG: helix-hairpin-helix domain-containing protein [Thermoleophilia bacterium]